MSRRLQDEEGIAQVGWHLSAQRLADEVIVPEYAVAILKINKEN